MRLSELRGVLNVLEYYARLAGNTDPLVEMFSVEIDPDSILAVDLSSIHADPAGQITPGGSIHIPLKVQKARGYIVKYRTEIGEASIVIQAANAVDAKQIFAKHFINHTIMSVQEEL